MIVVVAALKGGVGKTTTAVYLAALAAGSRKSATLVDADPQASSADWIETATDDQLEAVTPVEAPTDRLLSRALSRIDGDEVADRRHPAGQRTAAREGDRRRGRRHRAGAGGGRREQPGSRPSSAWCRSTCRSAS